MSQKQNINKVIVSQSITLAIFFSCLHKWVCCTSGKLKVSCIPVWLHNSFLDVDDTR